MVEEPTHLPLTWTLVSMVQAQWVDPVLWVGPQTTSPLLHSIRLVNPVQCLPMALQTLRSTLTNQGAPFTTWTTRIRWGDLQGVQDQETAMTPPSPLHHNKMKTTHDTIGKKSASVKMHSSRPFSPGEPDHCYSNPAVKSWGQTFCSTLASKDAHGQAA